MGKIIDHRYCTDSEWINSDYISDLEVIHIGITTSEYDQYIYEDHNKKKLISIGIIILIIGVIVNLYFFFNW